MRTTNRLLTAAVLLLTTACSSTGGSAAPTGPTLCAGCYDLAVTATRSARTGNATLADKQVIAQEMCTACGAEVVVMFRNGHFVVCCPHCAPAGVDCDHCAAAPLR